MEKSVERERAEDIMIPLDRYPHIQHTCTLREAVVEMEKPDFDILCGNRRSLPRVILVFDDQERLVGMVRRRDILRGLEPKFLTSQPLQYRKKLFDVKIDPNLAELSYDRLIKAVKEQADKPVSEVMQPIKSTVDHDEHIVKVIYELVDNNVSLLPVLKAGKVIGVVRSVEAFHEVARILI